MTISDFNEQTKWCPQHGYPLPCDKCGLGLKELGIQQGRSEVIAWIKSHTLISPDNNSITRFEPFYQIGQDKLKEWGIE